MSQDDLAFLLDIKSGVTVGRFENFTRIPSLEAALALEVIFKRSASELFGGLYQQAEKQVAERAKILLERKRAMRPRKHTALTELAST